MEWPHGWLITELDECKKAFDTELLREVKAGHLLFDVPVGAIGYNQDDVLFELQDGSGRFVEVHLTWAGEREKPPWPIASLFDSFNAWAESVREESP